MNKRQTEKFIDLYFIHVYRNLSEETDQRDGENLAYKPLWDKQKEKGSWASVGETDYE